MDGDLKEQRCFRFYQVMVKKTLTLGRICSFRWLWSLSRSELEEGLRKGSLKYNSPLVRLSGFRNLGSFCFWNPQSWPLKSRIQLKECWIPLTIGLRNRDPLRASHDALRKTFLKVTWQGSYKKLQPFFKDFSRTTFDFQRPPTRNLISQIVQKCTFPVHSNRT